jgi:hypothetical protein
MATTTYNVYRVYFNQKSGPDQVAIALVPIQLEDQGRGRFYHVQGNVGLGMDYQLRPGYNFGGSKSFKDKEFVFLIPRSRLDEFEAIASNQQPPHDERVLMGTNLDPPAPDCTTWVDAVLEEARGLAE